MDMQRLNTGMMDRYEIPNRRPARINAVQFGMGEALLGTVDRLIDDGNALLAAEDRVGIACVQADDSGYTKLLNEQEGMYTLVIRGYVNEEAVRREQVVQPILRALEPDSLDALAGDAKLEFAIVDDTPEARALARRFSALRRQAGLPSLPMIYLGQTLPEPDACRALPDSLAFRSEPDEAARLCSEMIYLDGMLHLAEPFARLTFDRLPQALLNRLSPDRVPGVRVGGFDQAAALKGRLFDAGVFLMAAPGWLRGLDTLRDCMTHERLRRFVGQGFTEELMPAMGDVDRQAVAQYVIECFERYENPLNRNRLLRAAANLFSGFGAGAWAAMRRLSNENFEPPRRLSFALAAAIMLYAGARRDEKAGAWQVVRGKQAEAIHDDPDCLARFATLSHDMDPESLAYAVLADRELWQGRDMREIDGLLERVALDIAAMQRQPDYLPEDM